MWVDVVQLVEGLKTEVSPKEKGILPPDCPGTQNCNINSSRLSNLQPALQISDLAAIHNRMSQFLQVNL